jgi:CubicO group peptidase (beta-lactamase class C family)
MKRLGCFLALGITTCLSLSGAPADLGALLGEVRVHHHLPALACAVVRSNVVIGQGVVGVRQADDSTPAELGDIWHHGSITKSMTATLAAVLVEEGKIAWTNTLADVFPDDAKKMDPAWRGVTLELLLRQRGGAPDHDWLVQHGLWAKFWQSPGSPSDQRRWLRESVTALPPQNKPGTKYVYSNTGYILAGAMLEARTGKAWEQLITERLFRPLHMDSAGFGTPGTAAKVDQPRGHTVDASKSLKPVTPGPDGDNPPGLGPAGTVHCSLADLATYVMAHVNGELGRETPLKLRPETWHKLHTALPGQDYALGWNVTQRGWAGGTALNHTGSNTMWFSNIWFAPNRDFAVIILINVGGDDAFKATDEVASKVIGQYLRK